VPTLEDEGFVLWESDAILWYLAESRGHGALLPGGETERALIHQWMDWNAQHLADFTYRARVLRRVSMRLGTPFDEKKHAEVIASAGPTLAILDGALASRTWVAGSAFSIADIALAMNVGFGKEEGVALAPFPNVVRWFEALVARPAHRAAIETSAADRP
jgi:glutathione S-transferase